jgi:hypothetical protein
MSDPIRVDKHRDRATTGHEGIPVINRPWYTLRDRSYFQVYNDRYFKGNHIGNQIIVLDNAST